MDRQQLGQLPPTTYRELSRLASWATIRAAVHAGVLRNDLRGVYCGVDYQPLSLTTQIHAAQLAVGDEVPAGRQTAADVYGFGVIKDPRVQLVGPADADVAPQAGLVVHASSRVVAVRHQSGVLVTSAAQTVVDLARVLNPADGLAVVDRALRVGAVSRDDLVTEVAAHAGLRGVRTARILIELGDPRAESPQESRSRLLIIAGGLPTPRCQIPLLNDRGDEVARLDMGWEEVRLGVEYDGAHHASRDFLRTDRARQNLLGDADWQMIYLTDVDVYRRPTATVHMVRRRLRAAARQHGAPDPSPRFTPIKELWSRLKIV